MNFIDKGGLEGVIGMVFDLDIMKRTRERDYVDARMMYCYILMGEGVTCTALAKNLTMNHSSVLHYRNRMPWVLKSDAIFRKKYEHVMCVYAPNDETSDAYSFSTPKLVQEVIRLRKEAQGLLLRNEAMAVSMKEVERREHRLASLYRVIQERTPIGREESFAHKLTKFYNGQT
tara:strand:- start:6 stop:527 length:522 start_codon:yes stop_codon:yes gene_type:complete